jgi:GGDEF domain-containing protein
MMISEKIEPNKSKITFISGQVNSLNIGQEYPNDEGLLGWVHRKNKSLLVDNFATKENYIPRLFLKENPSEELMSLIAVPVVINEEAKFVISVESRKPHQYSEQHKKILETMAYQIASYLQKEKIIRQLVEQNLVEPKTGLGNDRALRIELNKEVQRSANYNKSFCLQILKLKLSNDAIDAETYERLMIEFVSFVLPLLNSAAYIFRLENGNLAFLWPEKTLPETEEHFQRVYQKIDQKRPWVGGLIEKLYLNGGTVSFPQMGQNANTLIQNANEALKKAELKGLNTIEIYQDVEMI